MITTRFGQIDVDESRVINMLGGGILGFEHLNKYIFYQQNEKTPFSWLQSVEDGATAFVVISPQIVRSDYAPIIGDDDVNLLQIESPDEVILLSIVTIKSKSMTVSANLRAPIVINAKKMLAKQIVLEEAEYPVQHFLVNREPKAEYDGQLGCKAAIQTR